MSTRDTTSRRTRYGSMSIVLIGGVTLACLFLAVLASRFHVRWDATATREHSLSTRTLQTLSTIDGPVEIVASVDPARMDARSRQQVGDVLSAFTQSSDKVRLTMIDVGSASAAAEIDDVVKRSMQRHGPQVQRHAEAIAEVRSLLTDITRDIPGLAARLDTIGEGLDARLPIRERVLESAAGLRGLAGDAERAVAAIDTSGSNTDEAERAPDIESVRTAVDPILRGVGAMTDRVASAVGELPESARDAVTASAALRDRVLRVSDAMARLEPLEPLMISRLLRGRPAVLIIAPGGVQAIDQASLFPTTARLEAAGASGAQIAFAGEEIIAGAISATCGTAAPIVVIVHAEKDAMLDAQRRPIAAGARIARLVDRLGARRIDVAEWAVAKDANRPNLTLIDRDRRRPVVWFVLGAPTRVGEQSRRDEPSDRAASTRSLATALRALIDGGEHVLMAMEPSELPAIGEKDPMLEPLTTLGVSVDTARPIIERIATPTGSAFSAYQTIRSASDQDVIGRAVGAMATMLHWPMPIRVNDPLPPGVSVTQILRVDASPNRWAESQWLGMRYLNVSQPLKAIMPRDAPTPGDRDDAAGNWTVAAAIERVRSEAEPVARGGRTQRVVLVASPSWYEDQYTELASMVEGRRVSVLPGNRELLDASVLWLAGLDEQLETRAARADVARIGALSAGTLKAIRWGLIAGLPGAVLAIGLILRWRAGRTL